MKSCVSIHPHILKNLFSSGLYAVRKDTKIARNPERTPLFFIHSILFFFNYEKLPLCGNV